MLTWLIRIVMSVSAVIAGWFVVEGSANFGIVQLVVCLLLLTFAVAVAAFWETMAAWFHKKREPQERRRP
jgi:hypothetical protein